MNSIKQSNFGFTIIELLIVVSLAGVLTALAVPGLGKMIRDNRLTTQANSVILSLNFARNETINRGVDVRVEPIVAGTTWTAGWLVRIDGNNDDDFADSEDIAIRNFEATESATLSSTVNNIIYEPDGNVTAASVLTLTPTTCVGESIRQISVSITGHARVTKQDCP